MYYRHCSKKHLIVRDFTHCKLFVFSSQEPDAKRQRVDDESAAAASALTDTQANNSAYNYNWYQVGLLSEEITFPSCHTLHECSILNSIFLFLINCTKVNHVFV